jgi:hypothetical protein
MSLSKIDVAPVSVSLDITKVHVLCSNFELNATEGSVQVVRYTANDRFVDTQIVLIPSEVYVNWGTDDNVIIDYALQQLGMERATTTT